MKAELVTNSQNWNDFIAASPFGDILQTWEWGQVKANDLWQPYYIRVTQEGKTLGQALVLRRAIPLGFNVFYMPRGPVLDYTSPQSEEILRAILDQATELAKKHKGLMVKIGPSVSLEQAPQAHSMLSQLGLVPSSHSIQMRYTRIVDLQPPIADILKSFDKDTRNLVRRAAKEGVVVDHYNSVKDVKPLRAFHNMYAATATRGSFPARSWSHIQKVWELLAPQGMAHIYTSSHNNDPLASSIVLPIGDTAYQLWSGSRRDVGKKFPTYALQWAIMTDMKEQGYKYYDMWGIAPTDDPQHPWAGPTLFKKGFKGKRVEYVGDYDLPVSPFYRLYILVDALRQKILARGL